MAKFTKPIIVAASVAAVIGVGAVSFAAWTQTKPTQNQVGGSGSVSFVDFNNTPFGATTITGLLPYDQPEPGTKLASTVVQAVTLGTSGKATLTVYVDNAVVDDTKPGDTSKLVAADQMTFDHTPDGNGKDVTRIYASSAYNGSDTIDISASAQGWTLVSNVTAVGEGTPTEKLTVSITSSADQTIYFILDSDQNGQMNKYFKIHYILEADNT